MSVEVLTRRIAGFRRFAAAASLLAIAAVVLISCTGPDREKEQLRKEAELARKEADLLKRESELNKNKLNSAGAPAADGSTEPTSDPIAVSTPEPIAVATPETNDVSGSWSVNYKFNDGGGGTMKWKLNQQGAKIAMSSYSEVGGNSGIWVTNPPGKINGNQITLFFTEKGETVSYSGTVSGDKMNGRMSFGGTWTARKQS